MCPSRKEKRDQCSTTLEIAGFYSPHFTIMHPSSTVPCKAEQGQAQECKGQVTLLTDASTHERLAVPSCLQEKPASVCHAARTPEGINICRANSTYCLLALTISHSAALSLCLWCRSISIM